MKQMFKSKKGSTDILIAGVIITIFFLTAVFISDVTQSFGGDTSEIAQDELAQDIKDKADESSLLSAGSIFLTVIKLALLDWNGTLELPFWIEALYSILAIILILAIISIFLP